MYKNKIVDAGANTLLLVSRLFVRMTMVSLTVYIFSTSTLILVGGVVVKVNDVFQ